MTTSKKSVCIRVVEDDDVVQHMLMLSTEEGTHNKTHLSKKSKHKSDLEYKINHRKSQHTNDDGLYDNEIDENVMSPAIETEEAGSLYGNDMFKFKSIKKGGQMKMTLKAQVAASPRTPSQRETMGIPARTQNGVASPRGVNVKRTPSRRSKTESPIGTPNRRSKSGPLTPIPQRLAGAAQREHTKAEQSTPYRLRQRNMACIADGDGSDEDSVDDSTDESDEEKEGGGSRFDNVGDDRKTGDLVASAESYFDIHSMNPVTSDRTLSNLSTPRMDVQAIRQALRDVAPTHARETANLMECHKSLFDEWMLDMCQDYNILTYGLGSKQSLLESFRQSHLKPFSHLVINGYFPSLTIKHILNSITEEILKDTRSFPNVFAQIEFIERHFKTNDEDCFLLIHNIDGVLLRSKKCQNILSLLSAVPGIHIVASVDHINAPLLWDEIQFFRFRWLWFDTTTFLPYQAENSYENSLMVQQSGGLALSSLVHVMRSLTPNAKRIFLTLAEFQLEQSDSLANYDGMSFQALYQKCREDFLVNSDLTLQAQLVEFKDHRLIRAKKNYEGVEHLLIPIDKTTLKVFLDEQKEAKS